MRQAKPVIQDDRSERRTVLLAVDLKNSVLAEIDATNPNHIAYSPYGHQSSRREVMTRLGFNGEMREAKPEWYLLGNGHRVYNPQLMHFHSPDGLSPFGKGGFNAYMYCEGEPVMNSDPTGQSVWALSRFVQSLTGRVGDVAIRIVSKTANTVGSGVSQVLGATRSAAQSAKKVFTDNFLFDPEVIKKLGPPPPIIKQSPPPNHVFYSNRYPNLHSSPHLARQPDPSGTTRSTSQLRSNGGSGTAGVSHFSANTGKTSSPVTLIRSGN
ncbi:MAG: RHS repeat-associated core domain-containing protein [Pseudomonas sp.]|uniref:RHS repeat-associated core domain-containing protein n=1 Tax=Pseudomonas sp. TaxID=306 RepID=UPI003D6FAAFC